MAKQYTLGGNINTEDPATEMRKNQISMNKYESDTAEDMKYFDMIGQLAIQMGLPMLNKTATEGMATGGNVLNKNVKLSKGEAVMYSDRTIGSVVKGTGPTTDDVNVSLPEKSFVFPNLFGISDKVLTSNKELLKAKKAYTINGDKIAKDTLKRVEEGHNKVIEESMKAVEGINKAKNIFAGQQVMENVQKLWGGGPVTSSLNLLPDEMQKYILSMQQNIQPNVEQKSEYTPITGGLDLGTEIQGVTQKPFSFTQNTESIEKSLQNTEEKSLTSTVEETGSGVDSKTSNTFPYTPGDVLGFMGAAYGTLDPLLRAKRNAAEDTPNINPYDANYGKESLSTYDDMQKFLNIQKDEAYKQVGNAETTFAAQARNASRSSATYNANRLAGYEASLDQKGNIETNFANQMMQLLTGKSNLQLGIEDRKAQGKLSQDLANRQDKDAADTQMGKAAESTSLGMQSLGKMLNKSKEGQGSLSIISDIQRLGMVENMNTELLTSIQTTLIKAYGNNWDNFSESKKRKLIEEATSNTKKDNE